MSNDRIIPKDIACKLLEPCISELESATELLGITIDVLEKADYDPKQCVNVLVQKQTIDKALAKIREVLS